MDQLGPPIVPNLPVFDRQIFDCYAVSAVFPKFVGMMKEYLHLLTDCVKMDATIIDHEQTLTPGFTECLKGSRNPERMDIV